MNKREMSTSSTALSAAHRSIKIHLLTSCMLSTVRVCNLHQPTPIPLSPNSSTPSRLPNPTLPHPFSSPQPNPPSKPLPTLWPLLLSFIEKKENHSNGLFWSKEDQQPDALLTAATCSNFLEAIWSSRSIFQRLHELANREVGNVLKSKVHPRRWMNEEQRTFVD